MRIWVSSNRPQQKTLPMINNAAPRRPKAWKCPRPRCRPPRGPFGPNGCAETCRRCDSSGSERYGPRRNERIGIVCSGRSSASLPRRDQTSAGSGDFRAARGFDSGAKTRLTIRATESRGIQDRLRCLPKANKIPVARRTAVKHVGQSFGSAAGLPPGAELYESGSTGNGGAREPWPWPVSYRTS